MIPLIQLSPFHCLATHDTSQTKGLRWSQWTAQIHAWRCNWRPLYGPLSTNTAPSTVLPSHRSAQCNFNDHEGRLIFEGILSMPQNLILRQVIRDTWLSVSGTKYAMGMTYANSVTICKQMNAMFSSHFLTYVFQCRPHVSRGCFTHVFVIGLSKECVQCEVSIFPYNDWFYYN